MANREYKIVFTGSMGAGKTTAIAAVSEVPPVRTDVENNDRAEFAKSMTTAALDYGEVTLPDGDKLRLFGTPGQMRFNFMWSILGNGALGVVVLVDNSRPDPIGDMRGYLEAFHSSVKTSSAVVGIGRTEDHPKPGLQDYYDALGDLAADVPILSVDVRQREHVTMLLDVLFHQIEIAESERVPALAGESD